MTLIEKVARMFCLAEAGGDKTHAALLWQEDPEMFNEDAKAAIAVVLKEAIAIIQSCVEQPQTPIARIRDCARENGVSLDE